MRKSFIARALAGALLLLAGCVDSPVQPEGLPPGHARLLVNATAFASAATLVVEVTGEGIAEPLVFNLPVVDGTASGSVDVPVGSSRVFTGRLYDTGGTETHRGQRTTAVDPGANAAISLRLEPLNGTQPVDVVISSYTIQIVPLFAPVILGRAVQMRAIVRDADGDTVPDPRVTWAVMEPTRARIGPNGLLEIAVRGTVTVVAVYGGVAATSPASGVTVQQYAEYWLRESFRRWWGTESQVGSVGMMLSVQSFQHSAWPPHWGMYLYSEYPRIAIQNDPTHEFYTEWSTPWTGSYSGIAALREGFAAGGSWHDLRARAFAKFMLGVHLGNVALLYDQGLVLTESQDPATAQLQPYPQVMNAALAALDEAIALTQQGDFIIPVEWTSTYLNNEGLRRLAYSFKARLRANVARTPAERAAVDWSQVIGDADNGITSDFDMVTDWFTWWNDVTYYMTRDDTWAQLHYQYLGMADQSGKYQTWINLPVAERHPDLGSNTPFTIITPDNRFPQGATLAAQRAAPGRYYQATASTSAWNRPDRGTHRWSYYGDQRFRDWRINDGPITWFPREELDLLRAEGYYRTGNLVQAAYLVNATRVAAGLDATTSSGLNTSCVPRLPNGTCGDLFEMLKWEYRLETQFQGMFGVPWYFLARGWGDHYRGTQLQFPVPCAVARARGVACYTFGGVGGNSASTGSAYAWPYE